MAHYYTDENGATHRHGRGIKHTNCYADTLPDYDKIPKAVFAAVAVSYATCGGDWLEEARARILNEWRILYNNGIVPQRPPASMWVDLEEATHAD